MARRGRLLGHGPDRRPLGLRIAQSPATPGASRALYSVKGTGVEAIAKFEPSPTDELAASFRLHEPWLLRRLTLIVGDPEEARDLVQETFVRAVEHGSWGAGDDGRRWLASVGIRLAISELRRRKRWGYFPIREDDQIWALQTDPDLWRALSSLDRQVRAALLMTVLDGFSQAEAGDILGVPRGTIASWLSRARDRLRPILEVDSDATRS